VQKRENKRSAKEQRQKERHSLFDLCLGKKAPDFSFSFQICAMTSAPFTTTTTTVSISSSDSSPITASSGFLIGGSLCLVVAAGAFALSRSQRKRAHRLESALVVDRFDTLGERVFAQPRGVYCAVRGLVQAEMPLLSTQWSVPSMASIAVQRTTTLHVDVLTVSEQRRVETTKQTTTTTFAGHVSAVSQVADQVHKSHNAQWHRETEQLHRDFDSVPFSVTDAAQTALHVVLPDPSVLPLVRVHNEFVPATAAAQPSTIISVNIGLSAQPMTGDVDRRVVGTQREEFVVRCDLPMLVVGECTMARDGSGLCIGAPTSPHLEDFPFVVSSDSFDQVIADANASARSTASLARVLGGIAIAVIALSSALRYNKL
jgi:hypothetical protein